MKTIGIIGFGNMGSAMALGLKGGEYRVLVAEKVPEVARLAADEHGFEVLDREELVSMSSIVVLAVKPQDLDDLISQIASRSAGKFFISNIAGRRISYLMDNLKAGAVARFMPNLAARYGKALVGVSFSPGAEDEFKKHSLQIAGAMGTPCEIPESLMPAVTGLSGSGIAFVFAFLHAMALGGVKSGIPYPSALEMALQVVEGAADVVRQSGKNPIEWLSRVVSPAGTTIQGVTELEKSGFTYGVLRAVELATEKAAALED